MIFSKIRIFFILLGVLLLTDNCSSDESNIPNVSVSITIDPTTLAQLGVNSSMYYQGTAGVKGIIIYKQAEGEYLAFERLCPYYPNDDCAINIDDSKITGVCPCCGSEFSLVFGSMLKGPATHSLKQYQTSFIGNRLYISN